MVVVLIELHPFIPLSMTLIVFQGHKSIKQFQLKFFVLIRLIGNLYNLLIVHQVNYEYTTIFIVAHVQGK